MGKRPILMVAFFVASWVGNGKAMERWGPAAGAIWIGVILGVSVVGGIIFNVRKLSRQRREAQESR